MTAGPFRAPHFVWPWFRNAAEVIMPTQIPAESDRSWIMAAKTALMHSLLAAAIIYVICFIIVWIYT